MTNPTLQSFDAQVKALADEIEVENSSSLTDPTFAARDLGFPDYTKVHRLARRVFAEFAARHILHDRERRPAHEPSE